MRKSRSSSKKKNEGKVVQISKSPSVAKDNLNSNYVMQNMNAGNMSMGGGFGGGVGNSNLPNNININVNKKYIINIVPVIVAKHVRHNLAWPNT